MQTPVRRSKLLAVIVLAFFALCPALGAEQKGTWSPAAIVQGDNASDIERLAAKESQRYLYRLSGTVLPIAAEKAWKEQAAQPVIVLGTPQSNSIIKLLDTGGRLGATEDALGDQGFIVRALEIENRPTLAIAAPSPVGVLYGAYTFLEHMGVGFYLGGDAVGGAQPGTPPQIPAGLNIRQKPVFAIRGSLPWYNFLNSPTTWDLDDFKYFFDQMSKMKNNFVGFHTYDSEPFAPLPQEGKLLRAAPLVTSKNYGWGTVRGLATEQFGFGTGEYFDQELFGSRATTEAGGPEDAIRRAQAVLAAGLDYAKKRGIKVCVGFEATGNPADPDQQTALEARLRELVCSYPMLDYVWLWQSEGLGGKGADLPPVDSPLDLLVRQERRHFEYLKDPRRIVEAVRVCEYARLGHTILKRLAPHMRLVVSGWGGDKWMRFSDFYEGFDKALPPDVVFAALDNIDPAKEPNVSAVYGKVSAGRERWPIPWWESDGGGPRCDQFCPQPNTREFALLCRDALQKGCQGLLAIHWRTRDVEEAAAYQAQFAWEPDLAYEEFYRRFALRSFGKDYADEMSAILRRLESLGQRWTGGGGQAECARFTWLQGGQMPKPENLKALREIRARLVEIQKDMKAQDRPAGLERMGHLIATIDWVTLYDAAAVKLHPNGDVPNLIAEAESLKRKDDAAGAARKAQEAWDILQTCSLREAMRIFPTKMTTRGEFGALATINVKAYASFMELEERIRAILPNPYESARPKVAVVRAPEMPGLHIVAKTPPTIFPEKQPIAIRAAVIAPVGLDSVTLYCRKIGEKDYRSLPMEAVFRRTYEGVIPGDMVGGEGIEFYLEAKDTAGNAVTAPRGGPGVTYSGAVMPAPDPSLYITQCDSRPRLGQNYKVLAMVVPQPPECKARLRYRPVGKSDFQSLPMTNTFYDSFEGRIPATDITPQGVEYFVEVEGAWWKKWTQPAGGEKSPRKDTPDMAAPEPIKGLKAEIVAPYEVRLTWPEAKDDVCVAGYEVYRGATKVFPMKPETLLCATYKTEWYDVGVRGGETYWYLVRARDAAGQFGATVEAASVTVPKCAAPAAPANLSATPGRGKVKVLWNPMELPVVGYNVYRNDPTGKPVLLNTSGPVREGVYIDAGLKETNPCVYTVRAVDRGGLESEASKPASATPLPPMETPVFAAHFENSPDAVLGDPSAQGVLKGRLEGRAAYAPGVAGQALDLIAGGWAVYPHHEIFDITGELTLEAWVKFATTEGMPVFISHGHWRERGFFVQSLGGRIRFHLGGLNDCDAGRFEPGKWYYVVCTYDMKDMRVYVNGREVGRRATPQVDMKPWTGPFYIGRYTLDGKPYEVRGLIDEVRIYQRARTAQEIKNEYDKVKP